MTGGCSARCLSGRWWLGGRPRRWVRRGSYLRYLDLVGEAAGNDGLDFLDGVFGRLGTKNAITHHGFLSVKWVGSARRGRTLGCSVG